LSVLSAIYKTILLLVEENMHYKLSLAPSCIQRNFTVMRDLHIPANATIAIKRRKMLI
jgi:hypothetical protein